MLGPHPVPLLQLSRVEETANLRVGARVDLQTLEVAIVLGKRSVLTQALHLGALGLEDVLRFADRR